MMRTEDIGAAIGRLENAAVEEKQAAVARVPWSRSLITVVLFVGIVGVLGYRASLKLNVPGEPDEAHWALRDFRDAIYYPMRAFLDGNNPYDAAAYQQTYPVGDRFPLYAPHTLLVHLPIGLLPYPTADLTYFAMCVALTLVLSYLVIVACHAPPTAVNVFGLGALILISRPGHWNLLLGQYTLTVVLGTYLALLYARRRPWLAGLGLVLAAVKPTFGVPLAALMLWRRDFRAVAIGVGISAGLSAIVAAILVHNAGGVHAVLSAVAKGYAEFAGDPDIDPAMAPFRADAVSLAARLLGSDPGVVIELAITAGVLSLAAAAVWVLSPRESETDRLLSSSIVCCAVAACIYHQSYDLLLVVLPATALVLGPLRTAVSRPVRFVLLGAFLIPAGNYLASATAIHVLDIRGAWLLVVTSLNNFALLTALLVLCGLAFRRALRPS